MHNESDNYHNELLTIGEKIKASITNLIEKLGGKICMEYYHTETDCERYIFSDTDKNGFGIVYYVNEIFTENGEPYFRLADSEGGYETEWNLDGFTTSELVYLLMDIEGVANYIEENGEEVITDYPEYA